MATISKESVGETFDLLDKLLSLLLKVVLIGFLVYYATHTAQFESRRNGTTNLDPSRLPRPAEGGSEKVDDSAEN
jgi:hypothetical protein